MTTGEAKAPYRRRMDMLRAARGLVWRRRDELGALAMLAAGQLVVWTVPAGGDTLLHGSRAWNAVVLAAVAVPLAWRRRAPLGAVVAAAAAQGGTHLVARHGIEFLGFVPMLVLTSSAGWHLRGRRVWLALAAALAGLAAVELPEPTMRQPEKLLDVLWLAVPWGLLRALRAREERVRRLAGELAAFEATQAARHREVVAAERARIARDLHDVVAHATSVMVIQVGAARLRHEAGESDIGDQLAAAEATGRQAIAELRRLLDVLRSWPDPDSPADAPEPPQPHLEQLAALVDTYRAAGLDVRVTGDLPGGLPLGVQVSAYRIVQEALTNTLRHGAGRPVVVGVGSGDEHLRIEVSDQGDAAPGPVGVGSGGHGLVGMAERARLLGGSVTAGPNADGGWTVLARLPLTGEGEPVRVTA
jgi:signal transduction histidine kinase